MQIAVLQLLNKEEKQTEEYTSWDDNVSNEMM